MIIGYDGKRAVSNLTGLGNYSRLVIEEIGKKLQHGSRLRREIEEGETQHKSEKREFGMYASSTPARPNQEEDKLLIYTPKMVQNSRLEPIRRLSNVEFRFPPSIGLGGALWRTYGVSNNIAADGCRIYHGLSNELPLNIRQSGVKSVVTIHDVIYRRLNYCYTWLDCQIYDYKYGHSCHNADRIIAVSECTKRDIMEFYGIEEDKIDVIYQGCSDIFRATPSRTDLEDARRRLNLPKRFIVQVGTVERRKNLELTLRALSAVPRDIHLVVVGKDHHGYMKQMMRLVDELGLGARVHFLNHVGFRDLPLLYALAEVSIYPSRYEGFGIPILESIESGTPVVAATGSCLEEAGGEGGIYVNPDVPREMSEAICALTDDPHKAQEMVEKGKKHVRKFDNSRMADNILATYEKVISNKE